MKTRLILMALTITASFAALSDAKTSTRKPNQSDEDQGIAGNIRYSVAHGLGAKPDVLTIKDAQGAICTYGTDAQYVEGFPKLTPIVTPINFKEDPDRFYAVQFINPSHDEPDEMRILDLQPAMENRKPDVVPQCTFGTVDNRDQVFAGLKVTFDFDSKKDKLIVKQVIIKDIDKRTNELNTTTCTLFDDEVLACDKGRFSSYRPGKH